jgi:Spy/CpxP family protein refolding chaperone
MRKLLITLGILFMVGILAAPVFAHRWGMGGYGAYGGSGYGPCWLTGGEVTDSQRAELDKLQEQFESDTAKLREEIWNKSSELDTLMDSANPDANKVKTLQKEISDLQTKMADRQVNLELQAHKIAPDARFGRGFGRGYGMGQHYGPYGPRGPRYGQGYGPCWQ